MKLGSPGGGSGDSWFKHIYFKVTMIIQTDMTYTQKIGLERKHKLI